jgi:hypothetical protein
MNVLTMRSCKRYAVRQSLLVVGPNGSKTEGLLIELAQEGCRISGVEGLQVTTGDAVVLDLGEHMLRGLVRWAGIGIIGVRFEQALFVHQLGELIAQSRCQLNSVSYGT